MARLETSVVVDAPCDAVYDVITDLAAAPERISAIKRLEVLTDGPFGPGTRFRETRVMFGREATEEMTVTEVTPGESYVTEAESCGCLYRAVMRVAPEGGGSRLTMEFESKPLRPLARVMCAVMMPLMKSAMRKAVAQDLRDIKAAVESGRAAG